MSADRLTASFGDPNAVPHTPKQTPTSSEFPPAIFETPRASQASFEALSRWTPQSVEEYTFDTTDGNSPGSPGPFADLAVSTTPYQPPSSHKLLAAGSVAAEIASHVDNCSPTLALSLPPVDPSRRLPSSPTATRPFPSPIETGRLDGLQQRTGRKVRRATLANTFSQTVTPPPSTRKSGRRLAPKPQTESMQNEEFETEFAANASQQHILGNFASGPMDMFGLPLPATSTASSIEESQPFWDPGMSGMDIDFSIPLANAFNGTDHRPMVALDWGKGEEMFQETGMALPKNSENLPLKRERLLAPKPGPMPKVDTSMAEASVFAHSFHVPADDTFVLNPAGGVDPGLLLTRPSSSNMDLAVFDPMAQPGLMNALPSPPLPQLPMKEPKRGQVRRSASTREMSKAKKDKRAPSSSPVKVSSRPGLLRSASESRARKPTSRAMTLSNMAPLIAHGPPARPSHGSQTSGRVSPLKNHQRLPSLSSIPEHTGPRTRTSVRFTIDARGRARAETTVIVDEEQHTPTRRRRRGGGRGSQWDSSDDDSSSTDGEPIIIPSRNNSFALPESSAPLYTRPSHESQKSLSNQSTSSLGIYYGRRSSSQDDAESEAEMVTNVSVGNHRGDAMSELRKVREDRQRRMPALNTIHQFSSGAVPSASSMISPTNQGETVSAPSMYRGNQIRCVCNTTFSHINGDSYMVQCESCEMWLHGNCVKLNRQTLPRVYICAFCANTPSSRGVRGRGMRKTSGVSNPRIPASSPLSHKSMSSFR